MPSFLKMTAMAHVQTLGELFVYPAIHSLTSVTNPKNLSGN
jgi:hypothetical protein